jgi:hypothetical protein
MAIILSVLSVCSFFAWKTLIGLLRVINPNSALVRYLNTEVTLHRRELQEFDRAQSRTISRMHAADQILMFVSRLPLTQARAAKRRYWKAANPSDYAKIYKRLGYSRIDAEVNMRERNMPGYFRKKVHACRA